MADVFDKETRSRIMSRIRSNDTGIEVRFRKALWAKGLRGYRLHYKIQGKPDIVFPRHRLVIFLDGDYWHGYNWKKLGKVPPKEYWQEKIQRNIDRDRKNTKELRKQGWTVVRFWEHGLNTNLEKCISRVQCALSRTSK